jgi:acyl dehydratase
MVGGGTRKGGRMARAELTLDDYRASVGQDATVSEWVTVDQARIDAFAHATGDHQFIHVDPVAAAATPFGGTIAHGFLTLSLCSAFAYDARPTVAGVKMGVNYGLNKVRFMAPVRAGKRVRGRFRLVEVSDRSPGVVQSVTEVTVEIEGEDKPALAAEWVTLMYV